MKKIILTFAFIIFFLPKYAKAYGWNWSLGYNNPPGATIGLNFMYLWTNWAFEFGVGGVQQSTGTDSSGKETKTTSVLGDIDFKYLFGSSWVRPYLQVGAGSSASVTNSTGNAVSAGIGGMYYGGGIFLMGNPFHLYVSYNVASSSFVQAGIGFNF